MWVALIAAGPMLPFLNEYIMDMTSAPVKSRLGTILYHEKEAPEGKRVYTEDVQEWLDKAGWFDTPAKFGKKEVKPGPVKVIEKIEEFDPTDINDASDLSDYLKKEYGIKANYRVGLAKLKKLLKEKLDDNSIKDN